MTQQTDLLPRVRAWTYHRQMLGQAAPTVEAALHQVVGVYSSHPSAPLTLWARTPAFSTEAFLALEAEKRAARVPAQRGSIFLLLAEDAAVLMAALASPLKLSNSQLKYYGITVDDYPILKAKVVEAAQTPLLATELRKVVGESESIIASMAKLAAREGEIVRLGAESLRSNGLRYVSTRAWMPELLEPRDPDDALASLAARYLAVFGPARVADFQWWIGTDKKRAKAAIDALDTVDLGGGLLLAASDAEAFEQTDALPEDTIDILPKWDSYTMGHAPDDRRRFVAPEMQTRVYTNVGDGLGVVLVGGKAAAAWSHNFSGNRMNVTLDIFDECARAHLPAVEAKFGEVSRVLSGTSCTVDVADEPLAPRLGFIRGKRGQAEE